MALINDAGNVVAQCAYCRGSKSTYEYIVDGKELGVVTRMYDGFGDRYVTHFRLFRCAGCGCGGLGAVRLTSASGKYPRDIGRLEWFHPETGPRLSIPEDVPKGIAAEFVEAERCLGAECYRASGAMFRSVLDKTMKANGYKTKALSNLKAQIDAAADDGLLTASRKRRAHDDIRVLGNDILHDEWRAMNAEDVEPAHRYAQRILEDFYDDRASVLQQLRDANREPVEPEEEGPE